MKAIDRRRVLLLLALITPLPACIPQPPKATFYPKTCELKMLTDGWLVREVSIYDGKSTTIWPPDKADATRTLKLCDQPRWQNIYDSSKTISVECWISKSANSGPDYWGRLHLEIPPTYWSRDSIVLKPEDWGI